MKAWLLSVFWLLWPVAAVCADATAITNARIYTLAGTNQPIERGSLLIENGRIAAVGSDIVLPADARRIDAAGGIVTPGLFAAASQLGLIENSSNDHSSDASLQSGGLGAGFDIQYAVNPNSLLIELARADGFTRAATLPGDSAVAPFGGLAALLRLGPGSDLLERPQSAVVARIGGPSADSAGGSRAAQWQLLSVALNQARHWTAPGEDAATGLDDLNSGALAAVLRGDIPLLLEVRRESDIRQAIRLKDEFDIGIVILGGSEAWRAADALAAAGIPVILDAAANLPGHVDEWGARGDAARLLQEAGVLVALYAGGALHYSLNAGLGARESAGLAVANGLPWIEALRALTVNPARIWQLDAAADGLVEGSAADLVVWDGDPLEPSSYPSHVFVGGREVSLETRQTRLRDRYLPAHRDAWPPAYH